MFFFKHLHPIFDFRIEIHDNMNTVYKALGHCEHPINIRKIEDSNQNPSSKQKMKNNPQQTFGGPEFNYDITPVCLRLPGCLKYVPLASFIKYKLVTLDYPFQTSEGL